MKIQVNRDWEKSEYTIGNVLINSKPFCNSLEPKSRGLSKNMSLQDILSIKVPSETAIPIGTYRVSLKYSSSFKRDMPYIEDVPGFSGVLIHWGNTKKDTKGCILLGKNTKVGQVLESKATFSKFMNLLDQAISKGEDISITII